MCVCFLKLWKPITEVCKPRKEFHLCSICKEYYGLQISMCTETPFIYLITALTKINVCNHCVPHFPAIGTKLPLWFFIDRTCCKGWACFVIMSFDNSEDVRKSVAAFTERTVNKKFDLLVFSGFCCLICKLAATTLNSFKIFYKCVWTKVFITILIFIFFEWLNYASIIIWRLLRKSLKKMSMYV